MAEIKKKELLEQLREMSNDDLYREITAQRALLYSLRLKNRQRTLTNTTSIRDSRRLVARALTILRERELAAGREAK